MRYVHILAALLLIASSGCVGSRRLGAGKGGIRITKPAERNAVLDRFRQAYYDLRKHSFVEADCDVHSSFIDEVDTALTAALPASRAALDQLHQVTMGLHLSPEERPRFTSQGEEMIRTGDQMSDSMIRHMISWSSSMLTYGLNSWRLFATGALATPPEPLLSSYEVYRDSAGYRIESAAGIEMIFDTTMRMTMLNSSLSNGVTTSKTYFRDTPDGLVLERIDVQLPDVKARWNISLRFDEVQSVLLPSKVIASVDGDLPQLDGTTRTQKMSFTFLLSGYHIVKG